MFAYQVDDLQHLTRCTVTDQLDFLQVAQGAQRLLEDPRAAATSHTIFIIADPEVIVSLQRLRMLLPLLVRWSKLQHGGKWAFVLPNETTRAMTEILLPKFALNAVAVECFTVIADAQCWIEAGVSTGRVPPTGR